MSRSIDVHTLAGAYALNAVTEIERAGFARHLAECETCATEVAELTDTAARLSAVAPATPPARLRDAVMEQVSRTRQVSAARTGRYDRFVRGVAPAAWRGRILAAVAAAVVALAGMTTVADTVGRDPVASGGSPRPAPSRCSRRFPREVRGCRQTIPGHPARRAAAVAPPRLIP